MYVVYTRIRRVHERWLTALSVSQAPPAYRQRLTRMQSPAARARTQAGLWLLEQALRRLGHKETVITQIDFSAYGRPQITGVPAFSISHSKALVACAIAPGASVGLDVEVRRAIAPQRLSRLMSPTENAVVQRDPERFFDFWCAREATVKATGRVGLARIRMIELNGDQAELDGREWPLRRLELAPGYAACLASDRAISEPELEECIIPAGV